MGNFLDSATLEFSERYEVKHFKKQVSICPYIKPNEQRLQPQNIYRTKLKLCLLTEKHLVRSKIEIDGSISEQVRHFNYLGCELNQILTKK